MPNPILAWLRGDDLKAKDRAATESKLFLYSDVGAAIRAGTLVHGPGATDILNEAWGTGRDGNSAVFACLMALSLAYVEPPLKAFLTADDGQKGWLRDSALQRLLDDPNPAHDALELWFWTQWARHLDGNAYLRKIRSGNPETGNVVELWPISPTLIRPWNAKDSRQFVDAYKYQYAPGKYEYISPGNIIHLRIGIDDRDHRMGLSPLKRLLREISSDEEATRFQEALTRNFGIPGMIVEVPQGANLDKDQAIALKQRMQTEFGSDNRGNVGVLTAGAKVATVGFSPEQMDLKALHDVPETRIAAVMGIPPIMAGLGVGLEQSQNYASSRQIAENFTERKLVPMWRMDASKLNKHLLPEFTADRRISIEHDLSDVRSLQEDTDALFKRLDIGVQGGWLRPGEARSETGFPDDPELDALWLAERRGAPQPALPPGSKAIELKALDPDRYPELMRAIADLAEPSFTEDLARYFDGARKRAKRKVMGG